MGNPILIGYRSMISRICSGSELVAEKLLVVTMSFPHVFSGNPLWHTQLDARSLHSGMTRLQHFVNPTNFHLHPKKNTTWPNDR